MLDVRVCGLSQLCETRTRRIERLLDDFPDRIFRLTVADVDLDPASTMRLSRAVERHPAAGLHTLRVVRSSLGNDGAMLLATGLSRNAGLRSLCLAGNGLSSRGCAIVVRALLLKRNPSTTTGCGGRTLSELDLGDNPGIGDAGCRTLAAVLRSPGCPLRRLSLRRCGIGPSAAGELFAALGRNSRLTGLDVGRNRIVAECGGNVSPSGTDDDVGDSQRHLSAIDKLAESLIVNRTLRELAADDGCGLTVADCRRLARALRTNTVLRRLRLDGNPAIGDAGAELLADGLRYNRGGIEELGLAGCSVGSRGLAAIVDATTRYNTTTRLVDLRHDTRRSRDAASSPTPRSDCSGSPHIRGGGALGSPDSSSPPALVGVSGNSIDERDEMFSTEDCQTKLDAETMTQFDRQLIDVVYGLTRPRIMVE